MCEKSPRHERKRSRTGSFTDMRSHRLHPTTNPADMLVEKESLIQIANDVRRRVHKWNVYYWGVVRGEDAPDISQARTCVNCKDETYLNVFIFEGKGDNGMSNIAWYIFPPS